MIGDLQVVGFTQTLPRRIAASATRYEVGEPLIFDGITYSTGTASGNTAVLADTDVLAVGTDVFAGIAISPAQPLKTGTLVAHKTMTSNPIANLGRIRGKAQTAANVDTDSEIIDMIMDYTTIDYNSTGGTDGGELYTIIDTGGVADASAFTIIDGNAALQTLDVTPADEAYRLKVA